MAINGGTVSTDNLGNITGSGLALQMALAWQTTLNSYFTGGQLAQTGFAQAVAQSACDMANAFGPAIVAWSQSITSQALSYTVQPTDDVIVFTPAIASQVVKLPASPSAGDEYTFVDTGTAATTNWFINGNGHTLTGPVGSGAQITVNANFSRYTYIFVGGSFGWVCIGT